MLNTPELESTISERLKANLDLILEIFCHTFERFDDAAEFSKGKYFPHYIRIKELFVEYIIKVVLGNTLRVKEEQHLVLIKVLRCFFALFESSSRATKLTVSILGIKSRMMKWLVLGMQLIGVLLIMMYA